MPDARKPGEPTHVFIGDEEVTWEEWQARMDAHMVSSIARTMVRRKMCDEASLEAIEDEEHGWCVLIRVTDADGTEERKVTADDDSTIRIMMEIANRYEAKNGSHKPDPNEPRPKADYDKFKESVGIMRVHYDKSRIID